MMRKVMRVVMQPGVRMRTPVSIPNLQETRKLVESISLDEAARLLLGDAHNAYVMRTKVRRIYDIANVSSSMNLIEKTHAVDTRKPTDKWLGLRGKDATSSASDESRKRAFGTVITNVVREAK
ncbi:putative transcription factor E2F-DP family [Rosa chinensis]|uniref:Putative transcription factor E2F-DP family n=1 Tax=Rosa chinensis TaxID=74649 RepID=A0A2P6QJF5_ROSCH|nr:E2F transcription factor-like E2FE isoform X2 [Rosa chinensis]PRQ34310.1 putative transcription factor E2F-DP family [Rosa chinensis]